MGEAEYLIQLRGEIFSILEKKEQIFNRAIFWKGLKIKKNKSGIVHISVIGDEQRFTSINNNALLLSAVLDIADEKYKPTKYESLKNV